MTELTPLTRLSARLFLASCVLIGAVALVGRAVVALGTPSVLDWDETYYASTAATVAHGLGFFPYVLGYPAIPDMGGTGYIVALYALAYRTLGPSLESLRLVSFGGSLLAVAGLVVLSRRWHGSAAALATLALTPALFVFQLTNSIRLDVFAVAFVAWVLVLYSSVASRPSPRRHLLLGFVLALGLEVHLHTAAAAFAIGIAYLVATVQDIRGGGRTPWRHHPVALLVAGYALGFCLFVSANVLPNPRGFFRTAALARLSAADSGPQLDLTASMDHSRLMQTFLSPALIVRKEASRYRQLAAGMPRWELALWAFSVLAFLRRPIASAGVNGRALMIGAILGGGIVFNGPSLLYVAAILPFFIPSAGLFLVRGLASGVSSDWRRVGAVTILVVAALAAFTVPSAIGRARSVLSAQSRAHGPVPPLVSTVTSLTSSPSCTLAGPTDLYAEYFMAYPRFVGTRRVEVLTGSTYYDLQDALPRYWAEKNPDVVFGPVDAPLASLLADRHYVPVADAVWRKPDPLPAGCMVGVTKGALDPAGRP